MSGDEFKTLLEAAADALVVCDGAERILLLNPTAERLLGWKHAELIGQPLTCLLPERLHRLEGQPFLHFLLGRRGFLGGRPLGVPVRRRDGVELRVELTVGCSGRGDGERILLSLRRLPERVDLYDEPEQFRADGGACSARTPAHPPPTGERLFRTVVENAPLGIFHFDRTPVITTCNDYFVRIIGSSKRVLIGLNLLTLQDEAMKGCVRATLEGERAHYEGEYRSQTAHKVTPVRVHFAPCYTEDGSTVSGGVGIVEDVTERRTIEEERTSHLARLDTLFRTAPVGLGFLDPQLRYVRVNEVLARYNGVPVEAHVGRRPREVLGPALGEWMEQRMRHVLETGEPFESDSLNTTDIQPGQPRRIYSGSLYPVYTPEGRLLGLGAVAEDVTERRAAEEERARLFREAQEAVRVREDFLSIASHELKTPLTPLSLRLANLERRLERGEKVDPSLLRNARQYLVRLTTLINDLLDASRIEAGRLALHPEPTRLDGLVEHVIHGMEAYRGERHIEFSHPEEAVQVHGDPYRLEQVLANLLENALKYSPDGGTVRVRLRVTGDVALLSVHDEGIGIPPEDQKLLFDRFFRARNASSRSFGGLGLGLYISRDIVERHGGRIWVESEVGRGSTFFVALPLLGTRHREASESSARHLH